MKKIRIFISSPSDVAIEREKAREVINRLQKRYVGQLKLEAVLWEDMFLGVDTSFQQGIESVLDNDGGVDIAVFILWCRLGSPLGTNMLRPDGSEYRSGTEREFELMLHAHEEAQQRGVKDRPAILAYFRKDEEGFHREQKGKSNAELRNMIEQRELTDHFFQEQFRDSKDGTNKRAYLQFESPSTFACLLRVHLQKKLDKLLRDSRLQTEVWDTAERGAPYRGLEAFDVGHANIFFGREQETADVQIALEKQAARGKAFVLLLGASGSGKSSLARAGVIPAIQHYDTNIAECRYAILFPGQHASDLSLGLASALASDTALPELVKEGHKLDDLSEGFHRDPKSVCNLVLRPILDKLADPKQGVVRIVLLVDQLEELFTHTAITPEAIRQFAHELDALACSGSVWVLATLRSDFYAELQKYPEWMDLKDGDGQYDVVAPLPAHIHRIITHPAWLAGLRFEEDPQAGVTLDQRILNDAIQHPDTLPHLQFLLQELYVRSDSQTHLLTYEAYETLGGVDGVLGYRAQLVYDDFVGRLDSKRVEEAFHSLMRALVTIQAEESQRPVRRYVRLCDITGDPIEKDLCDALVEARLLTADCDQDGQPVVAVGHETLFDSWPLLKNWVNENHDFLKVRARVESANQIWVENGRKPGDLLPPGLPLERSLDLLTKHPREITAETTAFIRASSDAAEAMRRQEIQRLRFRNMVYASLAVVAVGAAILAGFQWRQAKANAERADKESAEKQMNLEHASNADLASALKMFQEDLDAQQKGEKSLGFKGKSSWHEALALLSRALERNLSNEHAVFCLYDSVSRQGNARRDWARSMLKHEDRVWSANFSPDDKWVVTSCGSIGKPGYSKIWDVASGKGVGEILRHKGVVKSASFSPDSTLVVTASDDKTAQVWDVASGKPIGPPFSHGGTS